MAARALEIAGYRVSTAGAPREAVQLALAASSSFDLLITDVVLPEMSGRALAEQLLAMHPRLKVLYMSGYTDDAIVRQGVFAHETQFIHKPFDHDALLRKAREVLDLVVT